MSPGSNDEHSQQARLRAEYKGAFDEWSLQVSRLQAATASDSGSSVLKEAEDRVAAAESSYRDTRDRLTDDMINPLAETHDSD